MGYLQRSVSTFVSFELIAVNSALFSLLWRKRQRKDWCHLYGGRLVCRAAATTSGPYRIFVVFFFNVTHNCVDSQIHSSGPFCRSELITAVFRWHVCGSLQHEGGRDMSQSLADHEGQRDSPDPWPLTPHEGLPFTLIYQIITHLSKY